MSEDVESYEHYYSSVKALAVVGSYFFLLGAWRGFETLTLPSDMQVAPEFPQWLIKYLGILVSAIALAGSLMVLGAAAGAKLKYGALRFLGATGAVVALAIVVAHAYFVAVYERAFGEGGLFWGVIHLLTLTRTYVPGGVTPSGLAGYRIGQIIGFAIWSIAALVALVSALGAHRPAVATGIERSA